MKPDRLPPGWRVLGRELAPEVSLDKSAALADAYMALRDMSAAEIARWVAAMRTRGPGGAA